MTPGRGQCSSLSFLPETPSSRTLEGPFELTRRPSRALDSPRALLPELQRNKVTVKCGQLGAEVPGHRPEQLTQTLFVRWFFCVVPKIGRTLAPLNDPPGTVMRRISVKLH